MPIAIALLNGNTAPVRTRFFGSRSCDRRGRGAGCCCAARSARPPRRIRHTNRAHRDRRRDFPCSARAGRTPATAKARWHRFSARRGWPARRRGRDRRHRRRCRESRAWRRLRSLRGAVVGAAAWRAGAFAGRRQRRILHRDLRRLRLRPRRVGALVALRARTCRLALRSSCPSGGRSLRGGAGGRERGAARSRTRKAMVRKATAPFRRVAHWGGWWRGTHRRRGASAGARGVPGALGGFGLDLAYGLFQRQPLAGDFGFAQRRLDTAQLRDQRGARPFIKRTAALAGSTGVQSGDGAGNQRVVISHLDSTLRAFR